MCQTARPLIPKFHYTSHSPLWKPDISHKLIVAQNTKQKEVRGNRKYYSFPVYLTMISIWDRILGWLEENELTRMKKQANVASFEIVTPTCSKLYIIEYIVVFWLKGILISTTTQLDGPYKKKRITSVRIWIRDVLSRRRKWEENFYCSWWHRCTMCSVQCECFSRNTYASHITNSWNVIWVCKDSSVKAFIPI